MISTKTTRFDLPMKISKSLEDDKFIVSRNEFLAECSNNIY